jgi:hypothetical protein
LILDGSFLADYKSELAFEKADVLLERVDYFCLKSSEQ